MQYGFKIDLLAAAHLVMRLASFHDLVGELAFYAVGSNESPAD